MGAHHDMTGLPLYVTTFVELRYSLLETREEVMEGRRALDCRKNVEACFMPGLMLSILDTLSRIILKMALHWVLLL